MSTRAAAIILALPVLGLAAQREASPPPSSTIKVGTRLVQVDVLVHGKSGPITGLTRDDFTVLDQGRPQKIAVFQSAADLAVSAAAAGTLPVPAGAISNRVNRGGRPLPGATVLLLDLMNTQFDNQGYARAQLLKYLQSLHGTEQVAIYALGKSLRIVQDFTDDPQKLIDAVHHMDPKLNELVIPSLEHMDDTDLKMYAMSEGLYAQKRGEMTEQAIQKIAEHLSGMSGRKSLVWLSDAPGFNGVQYLARANVNLYPVQVRTLGGSGPRSGSQTINPWTPATAYLYDGKTINGIAPSNELALRARNEAVAASRGGVGFADARDLGRAVAQAEEDATHTYTLGFYPAEETLDGKVHNLTVSVTGRPAKPSLELRYRPYYFAATSQQISGAPADIQAARAAATVHAAFESPLNASGIGLAAKATAAGNGYSVDLTVDLRDLHFELQNNRHVALVEVNYLLERATSLQTRALKIQLTDAELPDALKGGLRVQNTFAVDGNAALRIVVRDPATGLLGSLRVPLLHP
ncbi:MAG TPA: VWA domain-containing protein [Bryobacteraceae bacterium]